MNAVLFQATGEVRRAKPGEWWLSKEGYCCRIDSIKISIVPDKLWGLVRVKFYWMDEHPILTRYEIEATPDVLRALGKEEG